MNTTGFGCENSYGLLMVCSVCVAHILCVAPGSGEDQPPDGGRGRGGLGGAGAPAAAGRRLQPGRPEGGAEARATPRDPASGGGPAHRGTRPHPAGPEERGGQVRGRENLSPVRVIGRMLDCFGSFSV